MQSLYEVLSTPTSENLFTHSIDVFNPVIDKYPDHHKKIIKYINDCFNYYSPLIVLEKDWGTFLKERFLANSLPEWLFTSIVQYEDAPEIVNAILDFIAYQKQPLFQTLTAKETLRQWSLRVIQDNGKNANEKKAANEMLSSLDDEINSIHERMRQELNKFGNFKGYDAVVSAKSKTVINIAQHVK